MKRILVIDDTPEITDLIQMALGAQGWHVETATNSQKGLALARAQSFDLILCDVEMPALSGYEILKQLRSNSSTAVTPFVFLSGRSDKPHVRQGMELGADDYIEKPFTISELIKAVRVRFEKQSELIGRAEKRLEELRQSLSLALPHELVTPLNTIMGFSSLLMDATLPPAEVQECARHIHDSAARLQRLVENFCFFAHMEVMASDPAKTEEFRGTELNQTKEIIERAAESVARQRNRKNDLNLVLHECEIPISLTNMERLVRELVDNAFKFSMPGTPVSVETRWIDDFFEISISDAGRGMLAEQIRNIGAHQQFERKLHEQQGSGLGLAIARRLVEIHGGAFWIESIPKEKTTVHAKLPINQT